MERKEKRILGTGLLQFFGSCISNAVLSYFKRLPVVAGIDVVLLTFKHKRFPMDTKERQKHQKNSLTYPITWKSLTWHSGRLKMIKKACDLFSSIGYGLNLVLRYKIQTVYSEGFPGVILGYLLSKISERLHLVHTY